MGNDNSLVGAGRIAGAGKRQTILAYFSMRGVEFSERVAAAGAAGSAGGVVGAGACATAMEAQHVRSPTSIVFRKIAWLMVYLR